MTPLYDERLFSNVKSGNIKETCFFFLKTKFHAKLPLAAMHVIVPLLINAAK